MPYNTSPTPTQGNGAFGLVPGQISAPPSIWEQLNQNVPNYGALTSSATGDIQSQLNGQINPATQSNIWDSAASRGVSLGQPNSPLSNMIGLNLTGQTSEGLINTGIGNYNSLTGTLGQTQQNPALLANIAETNSINAAAPNPQAAASYAQQLFNEYMQKMNPPQSGFYNATPAGGGGFNSGFGSDAQLAQNFQQFQMSNQSQMSNPFQVFNINGGAYEPSWGLAQS